MAKSMTASEMGRRSALALTPKQRVERARKAAVARWAQAKRRLTKAAGAG